MNLRCLRGGSRSVAEGQERGGLDLVVPNYFNVDGDDSDDSDYIVDADDEGSYFSHESRSWGESEEDEHNEDVIGGCVEGEVGGDEEEPNETEEGDKEHEQDETIQLVRDHTVDDNDAVYESDEDVRYNDVVYPDTPYDTDDEWFELEKEDRKKIFEPKNIGSDRFYLGQKFPDKWELLDAVFWYSMETEYDIMFYKRCKNKIGAKCSNLSCPWRLYSSIDVAAGAWRVRVFFSTHTCNKTSSTKMLKVGSIANLFRETIRRIPAFKASEIRDKIIERWHMNVSLPQCIAARRKAVSEIRGDLSHQFSRLYDYELEIQRSNPGTTTEVGTVLNDDGKEVFQRFYVCFARLKTAWMDHCRKVIGLDGAFLKWTVKGEVLAAIGRDGNNRIFPIAWAIVDVENTENWDWFIMKLRYDLQLGEGEGLTLLTDKQKGLVKAIADRLPLAEHRMCARHIYANWKKQHSDDILKTIFWKIASSYNEATLHENWQKLLATNPAAYESLRAKNPKAWCRAYFDTQTQCSDVHNNYAESFNRTIREARKKPLLQMLEDIRRMAMVRITTRKKVADKWSGIFTPRIQKELEISRRASNDCRFYGSTGGMYEVEQFGNAFSVDLGRNECACRQWQLTGIPCPHAIRVMYALRIDLNDHVSNVYSTGEWQETYKDSIVPMNGEKLWPKSERGLILPPPNRVMPGRPKNNDRIKEPFESKKKGKLSGHGRVVTCGNCHQKGHNRVTCTQAVVVDTLPKRSRGRPKKNKESNINHFDLPQVSQQVSEDLATSSQQNQSTSKKSKLQVRRAERIPNGYGLYVSPYTNNMYWQSMSGGTTNIAPQAPRK